jgi:branched-chain amino acid transport system permease protein
MMVTRLMTIRRSAIQPPRGPLTISVRISTVGTEAASAVVSGVDRFVKQPGLEPGVFGLILVLFILFEPLGIYGRWTKTKLYFSTFPLYKRATFKRQKTYMKSERLR